MSEWSGSAGIPGPLMPLGYRHLGGFLPTIEPRSHRRTILGGACAFRMTPSSGPSTETRGTWRPNRGTRIRLLNCGDVLRFGELTMKEAERWIDADPTNPFDVFGEYFKNYWVIGYSN